MARRFSAKYKTAKDWLKAHEGDDSAYAERIRKYISENPNATLAEARGHRPKAEVKAKHKERAKPTPSVESKVQVEAKPTPRIKEARTRALHAISRARREGISISRAAKQEHVSLRTVKKYGGQALRKIGEKWKVKKKDTIERDMRGYFTDGLKVITVNDSRMASLIGRHANAVKQYFRTGDKSYLKPFKGKKVRDKDGRTHELETDTAKLDHIRDTAPTRELEEIYPP